MNQPTPQQLGQDAAPRTGHWVQTERRAHEAWASLIARKPNAARLMHFLVANMQSQNAVAVSQKVLAKMMGVSPDTVQRSLRVLESERWIQIVKMNGPGSVAAYVVNTAVAWGQPRGELHLATFTATVVADAAEQDTTSLERPQLRKIPTLYPGEAQLPTGPGDDPPSQPLMEGTEPDLPALQGEPSDQPPPWLTAMQMARHASPPIPIPDNASPRKVRRTAAGA